MNHCFGINHRAKQQRWKLIVFWHGGTRYDPTSERYRDPSKLQLVKTISKAGGCWLDMAGVESCGVLWMVAKSCTKNGCGQNPNIPSWWYVQWPSSWWEDFENPVGFSLRTDWTQQCAWRRYIAMCIPVGRKHLVNVVIGYNLWLYNIYIYIRTFPMETSWNHELSFPSAWCRNFLVSLFTKKAFMWW